MIDSRQYPADVCPPAAITRRMRIPFSICMSVMYAVRYDPLDWPSFERHRTAGHEEVFDKFWNFVATMSEQPMPAHSDTQTAAYPVKDDCRNHGRPTPEKESCDGSKMRRSEEHTSELQSPCNLVCRL